MPKTYRVGETDYQFPDDFDDAKVQGILTQQGVIQSKRTTPRRGLKGPDAMETAQTKKAMGDAPDSSFLQQFGGTIMKDVAGAPEAVYGMAAHPLDTAAGVAQGLVNLPHDLATDIKEGKYGKLTARALEMIVPGLGSTRARELAAAADAAAGRTAAKVAASRVPEAIGKEVSSSITNGTLNPMDIVQRIRARLAPTMPGGPSPYDLSGKLPKYTPSPVKSGMPSSGKPSAVTPKKGGGGVPQPAPDVAPVMPGGPSPYDLSGKLPKYTPSPTKSGMPSSAGGNQSAARTAGTSEGGTRSTLQHLKDRGPLPPAAQAEHLARYLKSIGVSAGDSMSSTEWQIAAASAGLPNPTPEIIQAARGQLGWRPSPRGTLKGPK